MALLGESPVDRSRAAWWVGGLALGTVVVYVLHSFIGTFVLGAFLYYATRPIHRRVQRKVDNRSLAAGIALVVLALPALALAAYALVIVIQELRQLDLTIAESFDLTQYPGIDAELVRMLSDPTRLATLDFSRYITADTIRSALGSVGSLGEVLAVFGVGIVHLFVVLALAFYLLRDDHKLARWGRSRFGSEGGIFEAYAVAVDADFKAVFFGNILNAVLTGTIAVVAFTALNAIAPSGTRIPAAALIGLLAGVASLIPVVGMKLIYIPVAGLMTVQAIVTDATGTLWFVLAFALVSFVVVDTIPDLVLRPYVSGRSLHVGTLMLAYTLGPLLFGWYGLFLMPMLLILVVHFARLVLPELLGTRSVRPYAVDPPYYVGESTSGSPGTVPDSDSDPAVGSAEN